MRTGKEYLASLDNRACDIYVGGERVGDVRTHPATAEACKSVARLFDLAADPAKREALTFVDPIDGKRYNNMWLKPRSPDDLMARARVHRTWADASWGLFGRSPDHVAGWITGMACNPNAVSTEGERYAQNILDYYQFARERDLFVTYAIVLPAASKAVNAKITGGDASKAGQFANALRVVEERDDGIVVSGFKVLVTAGTLADEILFGTWQPLPAGQEKLAVTFALPVNTAGVKLISRRPYAAKASSVLDDPLSSRFDETDCIVYLEDVFVPWHRVFTYNRTERAAGLFNDTPAHTLGNAQAHIRLLSKLKLALGLTKRVIEHNELLGIPMVKDEVAKLAVDVTLLEGMIAAEYAQYETWPGGYVAPSRQMMYATMAWTQGIYPGFIIRARELLASHSLQQPADVSMYDNSETAALYGKFQQRSPQEAIETYKLMRLTWDLVGTEFASRHIQYEMFYNGPQFSNRNRHWNFFPWQSVDAHTQAALDFMGGYDELVVNRADAKQNK